MLYVIQSKFGSACMRLNNIAFKMKLIPDFLQHFFQLESINSELKLMLQLFTLIQVKFNLFLEKRKSLSSFIKLLLIYIFSLSSELFQLAFNHSLNFQGFP